MPKPPPTKTILVAFGIAVAALLSMVAPTALSAESETRSDRSAPLLGGAAVPANCSNDFCLFVVFLLKRQSDGLEKAAAAVSDPTSSEYGKYSTVEEVAGTYGASRSTQQAITSHLEGIGVSGVGIDPTATLAYGQAGAAQLDALFGEKWHALDTEPLPLPVPEALASVVEGVFPLEYGFLLVNAPQATIQLTAPADAPGSFTFRVGGEVVIPASQAKLVISSQDNWQGSFGYAASSGSYTVTVEEPAGWEISSVTTTGSFPCTLTSPTTFDVSVASEADGLGCSVTLAPAAVSTSTTTSSTTSSTTTIPTIPTTTISTPTSSSTSTTATTEPPVNPTTTTSAPAADTAPERAVNRADVHTDTAGTGAKPAASDTTGPGFDWPASEQGSGTHEACPTPGTCTSTQTLPGAASDFEAFTPGQLRTAYGITASGLTGAGGRAVVVETDAGADATGADTYTKGFGIEATFDNSDNIALGGALLDNDGEATLDVQTLLGLAPGLEDVHLLSVPDYYPYSLMLAEALDPANTGGSPPDVISNSNGRCEALLGDDSTQFEALDIVAQTAALSGITILTASGDQGSSDCLPHNAGNFPPVSHTELAVDFPGSSPWITSVGGTNMLLDESNSIVQLEVWNNVDLVVETDSICQNWQGVNAPCRPNSDWGGGGGTSAVYPTPSWQTDLSDKPSHRAVPDVAFLADGYPGAVNCASQYRGPVQCTGSGNGTSQAAPILAAMVLSLNQQAEAHGQPRVGFANPLLYRLADQHPAAFYDIVLGDNIVGSNDGPFDLDCCHAAKGFDQASGWGSLLVDEAAQALLPPPPHTVHLSENEPRVGDEVELRAEPTATTHSKPTQEVDGAESSEQESQSPPEGSGQPTALHYDWDLDGDGGADATTHSPVLRTRFDRVGTHHVALRVRNDLGRSSSSQTDVAVRPAPWWRHLIWVAVAAAVLAAGAVAATLLLRRRAAH